MNIIIYNVYCLNGLPSPQTSRGLLFDFDKKAFLISEGNIAECSGSKLSSRPYIPFGTSPIKFILY